jgi:hypothetical protein
MHFTRSNDVTLYDVTLKNSPNFHVVFDRGTGFTAWGVRIDTRDPRARNTDGIDPVNATNVTITHSFVNAGDDNVAIKAGRIPSSHITVSHDHFYRGHGMSIGSETDGGAYAIRVFDLSIDGADNGLRIKSNASRGGLVHDVEYRDVCIRNTKSPIEMDTHYTASPKTTGDLIPEYRDIRLEDVRVIGGGKVILEGYDAARRLGMLFDDVVFDDPSAIKVSASHLALTRGPGPMNLPIEGADVQITGTSSEAPTSSCAGKFVPMPVAATAASAGRYAAIVDASFRGTDADSAAGAPTFRSPPSERRSPRCRPTGSGARRFSSRMGATTRSSPSTGPTSRWSARAATGPSSPTTRRRTRRTPVAGRTAHAAASRCGSLRPTFAPRI